VPPTVGRLIEALALVERLEPQLVLLDIYLPPWIRRYPSSGSSAPAARRAHAPQRRRRPTRTAVQIRPAALDRRSVPAQKSRRDQKERPPRSPPQHAAERRQQRAIGLRQLRTSNPTLQHETDRTASVTTVSTICTAHGRSREVACSGTGGASTVRADRRPAVSSEVRQETRSPFSDADSVGRCQPGSSNRTALQAEGHRFDPGTLH
jgi:hypothetical protein